MKPKFKRCEYFRYKRLKQSWRKPRGKHNKMRNYLGGKMLSPAIGYGTNAEIRGLHPSGMREVLVENLARLQGIDAKTQAVRIAANVGKRKRREILAQAKKFKLIVLNPGAPAKKNLDKKKHEKKIETKKEEVEAKKEEKAEAKKAEGNAKEKKEKKKLEKKSAAKKEK